MKNNCAVVICAAGKGERAGFKKNKLLTPLYSQPVIYYTLSKFASFGEIIVTSSPQDMPELTAICSPFGAKVVLGGNTRQESVFSALKHVTKDIVLIHDGARPFVTDKIIDDCINDVLKYGSAITAIGATDTTILHTGEHYVGLDRSKVYSLQTPQAFYTKDILYAYKKAMSDGNTYTDDSSIYSAYCATPHLTLGDNQNIKLTYKEQFEPTYMPTMSMQSGMRIGFGVDIHTFGKEQNFITLAGVKIPSTTGLIAHSDGDVLVHAVMDALLSSIALKDIGTYFPDTDDKYLNIDSMHLLKEVVKMLLDKGYTPSNLVINVQAEQPKLKKYIDEMKKNLADVCSMSTNDIAISAGTAEGLGYVGQGLGICVYCIATVKEI